MNLTQARAVVRLGRRSAWRNPWRTGLIAALIGVAVAIAVFVAIAIRTMAPSEEQRFVAEFGTSAVVVDMYGPTVETIKWMTDELNTLVPEGDVAAKDTLYHRDGEFVAVDLDSPLVEGLYVLLEGRAPGPGEVALSWRAARSAEVGVGDQYKVEGVDQLFVVTAIVASNSDSGRREIILPSGGIENVVGHLLNSEDWYSRNIAWYIGGSVDSEVLADQIRSDWNRASPTFETSETSGLFEESTDIGVRTRGEALRMQLFPSEELSQPPSLVSTLVAVLLLVEVAFLAAAAYATGIRRRLREIGLISTQGATTGQIRGAVIGEAVVTGLIGAVAGAILALIVALIAQPIVQRHVNPLITGIKFSFTDVIGPIAVAVFAAVVAAWLPARTASRASILAALQGRMPTGKPPRWIAPASLAAIAGGSVLVAAAQTSVSRAATVQAGIGILLVILGGALAGVPLVAAAGRVAHCLPIVARLVARDSARQAIRAAAAIAALLVILTASVAIATSMRTSDVARTVTQGAGYGDLRIVFAQGEFVGGEPTDENPVFIPEYELSPEQERDIAAILPRAARYEVTTLPVIAVSAEIAAYTDSTGYQYCVETPAYTMCTDAQQVGLTPAVVDPALLDAIAPPEARDLLEAGVPIVLGSERSTMEIVYEGETFTGEVFPADVPPWQPLRLVVPESWASERGLLDDTHRAVYFINDAPITEKQRRELYRLDANVSLGRTVDFGLSVNEIYGVALAVALFAVTVVIAIVIALSSTESTRDLRVMVAVGAAPSLRRRFLGIQSVFYVAAAALIAIPIGLLLMYVVSETNVLFGPLGIWTGGIAVPWPTVAVLLVAFPLMAGVSTALIARSLPARPPRRAT